MTTILLLYYEHLSESFGHYIYIIYINLQPLSTQNSESNKQTVNYEHEYKFETYYGN